MTNKALLVGGIRACRQLLGHTHALTIASDNPESLDIGRREAELREAERELAKQGGQPVRRWWQIHRFLVPMFWRRDLANWYFFAGMVEDARAALQLITMRKSPPKCLACGSEEITTPLISDTSE